MEGTAAMLTFWLAYKKYIIPAALCSQPTQNLIQLSQQNVSRLRATVGSMFFMRHISTESAYQLSLEVKSGAAAEPGLREDGRD